MMKWFRRSTVVEEPKKLVIKLGPEMMEIDSKVYPVTAGFMYRLQEFQGKVGELAGARDKALAKANREYAEEYSLLKKELMKGLS